MWARRYSQKNFSALYSITIKLTSSESQGPKEAACTRPANVTTGVLFTATNAVKFPSAVTQTSWALPFSYYKASM